MKARIPRAPSAIEERLWILLLGTQRFPSADHFPRAQREFKFHPKRKWRFDFAWPEFMVAVECEGGAWSGGRHTRGAGFIADCEKYNAAALLGWRVFRFTADMVNSRKALEILDSALPHKLTASITAREG